MLIDMEKILSSLGPIANLLPSSVFSEGTIKKMDLDLLQADIHFPAGKYLSISLFISLITGAYLTFLSFLFFAPDVLLLISVLLLSFSSSFLLIKSVPSMLKKRRAAKLEAELPMILRSIAVQLNINTPFEMCIKSIAESNYWLSDEFKKAHKELKAGASIPQALTSISGRIDSNLMKRAMNQLIVCYEQGTKGDALKRIADELTSTQLAGIREFGGKMAFFGLLFIAASCLLPAFFEVFVVVGSSFLSLSFSLGHIWVAFLLFFPLLNILIILLIQSRTPPSLNVKKSLGEEMKEIKRFLKSKGIELNPFYLVGGAFLSVAIFALLSLFVPSFLFIAFILFISPVLIYFYALYSMEQRRKTVERYLPDALFQAASLQKGMPIERIFSSISSSGYGPLSEEFGIAAREIKGGGSVSSALNSMSKRNSSILLERANNLLLQGYESGADMYAAFRETADDILSIFSLVRERASSLSMQRYTLLIGGAVIVPLILGTSMHLVSGLSSGFGTIFGQPANDLYETSVAAVQIYLIIYALLASILIAQQEGESKKSLIYFMFIAPTAYILLSISRSVDMFSFFV